MTSQAVQEPAAAVLDTTIASETTGAAHVSMVEKLQKLELEREKERSKRLEERIEAADPRESIAKFNRTFEEERKR